MHKKLFVLIALGSFVLSNVFAKDDDKKIKILPVPTFGYSPETGTYIGAVSLFTIDLYQDSNTRTSNAKAEVNYTWRKQIILEIEWNYFFREEKWFTKGRLHVSKFPDRYWGIGATTPDENEYLYNSDRVIAEGHALKKIGDNLFFGPGCKYITYRNINPENEIQFPELKDNTSVGGGLSLLKDSRDNILTPSKGFYYNAYGGYVFTKEQYAEVSLDLRYYLTRYNITWASRFYNDFNFSSAPFYDLAILGGDKYVRGFYYGRYRDNHLSTLQTELRSIFIWRFGAAVFGGFSNVYSQFNTFSANSLKYNLGGGIRFLIDRKENINLRIDYAVGSGGNSGFYIGFGESF